MPASVLTRPRAVSKTVSPWVRAFRCLRWSTYLVAFITLALLLHKSTPPKVDVSPQAAERAEEKVQQVEQSAARGEAATLRLDQTELNSFLASHLNLAHTFKNTSAPPVAPSITSAAPPVPVNAAPKPGDTVADAEIAQARSTVRDLKVQMAGDQVHAYVVFDMHGKDMTLDLVGRLGSSNGYLKFDPVSGKLGALPIPQSTLESAVQRLMSSPENHEKLRLPNDIEEMHIENGELVATYH